MKKTKPKKLLTVLLTLYLALSIVPITAYAGVTDVTGGSTTNTYSHFYHTKVETTAQVIIKDADGNVIETTEVTKSGDFVEGNVNSDAVQAEIKRIDDEIIAQFSSRGNITTENRNSALMFDHFESGNIITGDAILVGDLDALENAASGSVNKNLVVHEYQVYQTTYDLIVQENNDLEEDQVITKVDVGNIWKELDSAKPVVFTGEVNPNSYCVNQMTLTEEIWYTADKFNGGSGDEITSSNPRNPIAGEEYRYRITLTAKDGYFFHAAFRYHGEGGATLICENQNMSMDMWTGVLSADQKQLTIYFDNIKTTAIDGGSQDETTINNAYIRNVKFAYRSGDAPQATAEVLVDPLFEEYEIAYECWEEMENGEPIAFWYSDESKYTPSMKKITQFEEGKTYMYSIELREKNGYTFADNCSVTINGNPISATANAVKTVDGLFIMNVDTINPKPAFKEIPVVEINNATLTFKDGDKPVFTGTTPDDAPYVLVFEEWRTDGEWTRSDEWFNNADHHGNDKDITAFDKNKSYNYTFYIKTNYKAHEEGWCFGQNTKLKINGKEVSLTRDVSDNEGQFSGATDIIMTPTAEISVIEINNATLTFKDGDKPKATATVAAADQGKYRIADEYWQELNENDVPVAIWHSDDEIYSTLPTITEFESGKKYVYSIMLMPERKYDFSREVAATVNGNSVTAVPATDGYLSLPNVKTMIPTESDNPAAIDLIEINDVTVSFKDGDKPVFTGVVPDDAPYAFRCEWWSLDENTGIVSTEPEWGGDIYKNKITAFEAGKTYHYGVYVTAYTADISPDAKLKINGREVKYTRIGDESDTQSFWVETDLTMTPAADGHTHKYGSEWKYDETNHWHECEDGEKADITAHNFKWIVDKKATTAEKGSKHEECTVCGYKKAAVDIPATGVGISSDDEANKPTNTVSSEISSADQTNKPINTASPKTGNTDNMILWIVLLVIGGGAFITATAVDKKKK